MGNRELLKVVRIGLIRTVYRKNIMAAGYEVSSHLDSYKGPLTGLPDSTYGLFISSQYCNWNRLLNLNQIRSVIHSTHPSGSPCHASTRPNITHHIISYVPCLLGTSNTSLLALPQTCQVFACALPSLQSTLTLRYPYGSQTHLFQNFAQMSPSLEAFTDYLSVSQWDKLHSNWVTGHLPIIVTQRPRLMEQPLFQVLLVARPDSRGRG